MHQVGLSYAKVAKIIAKSSKFCFKIAKSLINEILCVLCVFLFARFA